MSHGNVDQQWPCDLFVLRLETLVSSSKFCDLRIRNDNSAFVDIHKAVLTANSEKYLAIFTEKPDISRIEVGEIGNKDLVAVLKFMYSRTAFELNDRNVGHILRVALQLGFQDLQVVCTQYLQNFSLANVLNHLQIAVKYRFEDLQRQLLAYATRYLNLLTTTQAFLTAPVETPLLIIKAATMSHVEHSSLFNAAIKWLRASPENKVHTSQVFRVIPLKKTHPQVIWENADIWQYDNESREIVYQYFRELAHNSRLINRMV